MHTGTVTLCPAYVCMCVTVRVCAYVFVGELHAGMFRTWTEWDIPYVKLGYTESEGLDSAPTASVSAEFNTIVVRQ